MARHFASDTSSLQPDVLVSPARLTNEHSKTQGELNMINEDASVASTNVEAAQSNVSLLPEQAMKLMKTVTTKRPTPFRELDAPLTNDCLTAAAAKSQAIKSKPRLCYAWCAQLPLTRATVKLIVLYIMVVDW
jgi:hypothetical protein